MEKTKELKLCFHCKKNVKASLVVCGYCGKNLSEKEFKTLRALGFEVKSTIKDMEKSGWNYVGQENSSFLMKKLRFERPKKQFSIEKIGKGFRDKMRKLGSGILGLFIIMAVIGYFIEDEEKLTVDEYTKVKKEKICKATSSEYKEYIEEITTWTKKVDDYHKLATLSLQQERNMSLLYKDIKTVKEGILESLKHIPKNPDKSTKDLYDVIFATYNKRYEAWGSLLKFLETKNISYKNKSEEALLKSNEYWKMAVAKLAVLKLETE